MIKKSNKTKQYYLKEKTIRHRFQVNHLPVETKFQKYINNENGSKIFSLCL